MDLNHFKNLIKCHKEFREITKKAIDSPEKINETDVKKLKVFKILDMMYFYFVNNQDLNINEILESVRKDYDTFISLNPELNEGSDQNTTDTSDNRSSIESSEESSDSDDSDESELSDLESNDSDSVYSEKSDDEQYNKMVNVTLMVFNKHTNNKEFEIIRE